MDRSPHAIDDDESLKREGVQIARYLAGVSPPLDVLERYVRANRVLFPNAPSPTERATILFVRRHPYALPLVDAALGLLDPYCRLRSKILLMFALLETTPDFVDLFFPEPLSRGSALLRLTGSGARSLLYAMLGLAFYPLLARTE
ncbi:MAG: hypothetical protein C4293_18925 [Nitrospiraceae bacterium]